jgi:hypothetical protein
MLGAVLTLTVAVVPTLIVAASFANRDAYWRTTRLDLVCLTLAGAAVVVLLTSSGDVAIAMGITGRGLGAGPDCRQGLESAAHGADDRLRGRGVRGGLHAGRGAGVGVPHGRVRRLLPAVLRGHDGAGESWRMARSPESARPASSRDGLSRSAEPSGRTRNRR